MHQGGFYRIFNTIDRPSDGTDEDFPDGFELFELRQRKGLAIQTRNAVMEAGFHYGRTIKERRASASASASVLTSFVHAVPKYSLRLYSQLSVAEAGAAYSFECSDDQASISLSFHWSYMLMLDVVYLICQGAIVYFQHPVDQTMLHSNPRQYILKHFDSWVRFAKDTRNLDIAEDGLIFIKGFVKGSTQWAVAAVTHNGHSGTFSMNAGVLSSSGGPSAKIGFHGSDTSLMGLEKRQNPRDFVIGHAREDNIPEGQCFFINYFKVKRRRRWFGFRKIEAAAEPQDPSDEDTEGNDDENIGTLAGHAQEDLEVVEDSGERKVRTLVR